MMRSTNEVIPIPIRVLEIAESALAQVGRTPSGPPTVQRHWGISTILTFPTKGGPLWFKYVPPLFSHEGEVTSYLAEIVPDSLPRILAWDKGWMLMEEFPSCARPLSEHPLATLARIQLASADHLADLAAANCHHQPLNALVTKLVEFESSSKLLTRDQARALRRGLRYVSDACARMNDLHIPTTVVHGDFSTDNAHWGPFGWIIYDWTDAFLGNPFIDVIYSLVRQEPGAKEAFRRAWLAVLPPETVAQALALASLIGTAHYVIMHWRIMKNVNDPEPFRASLDMWLHRLSTTAY